MGERRVCHIYSGDGMIGNGDACCTCHMKTAPPADGPKLWPQFGDDHTKCRNGNKEVKNRLECQLEAAALGRKYYQYAEPLGLAPRCMTSDSCTSPIGGTKW